MHFCNKTCVLEFYLCAEKFGQNVRRKSRYTIVKIKSAAFSDKSKVVKKKVVQVGLLSKKVFIDHRVITIKVFNSFSRTFQHSGDKLRGIVNLLES